jgi:hypothetical protein
VTSGTTVVPPLPTTSTNEVTPKRSSWSHSNVRVRVALDVGRRSTISRDGASGAHAAVAKLHRVRVIAIPGGIALTAVLAATTAMNSCELFMACCCANVQFVSASLSSGLLDTVLAAEVTAKLSTAVATVTAKADTVTLLSTDVTPEDINMVLLGQIRQVAETRGPDIEMLELLDTAI